MSEIHIREFCYPDDYQAVRALWEHAGPGIHLRRSDELEEIQKKVQRDPDLFLVAEAGGQIIGTVLGGYDGRRGMIYHLAVAASFREQGVGSLLMDEVEKHLRLKGCIRSYLLVATDNDGAMRFYARRGWERMDFVYTYGKDLD